MSSVGGGVSGTPIENYTRSKVKAGDAYMSAYNDGVASLAYRIYGFKAPSDNDMFFHFSFFLGASMDTTLLRVETFGSEGTQLPSINLNSNSTKTAGHRFFYEPSSWTNPVRIIPSVGTDTGKGITFVKTNAAICGGLIATRDTYFLFSIQNLHPTDTKQFGVVFVAYENF